MNPAARQPLFVTDCEGPLTRNDNAAELAAAYLPDGGVFFAVLSKYDDYLADVVRKPGYNAGNTLALIAPFLRAFGLDDATAERSSRDTLLTVPGAADLVAGVRELMPMFVISTSYAPYVRAVAELLGLPFACCRCTELSLDGWELPEAEVTWLRERAQWISQQEPITLPRGAASIDDLSAGDRATVRALDALFWDELEHRAPLAASMIASVHPVGGHGKLTALQDIVAATSGAADVMYVGDSITDVPPLAAVKEWGGVALSFNGNGYALAAAEFAAAAADTRPTLDLARAFARGGVATARSLARAWPIPAKPDSAGDPAGSPDSAGQASAAPPAGLPRLDLPRLGLIAEAHDELAAASRAARAGVRGEHIAALG